MKDFDLLVIGEINPDLILRGVDVVPAFGQAEKLVDEADLAVGASSVITASGAARLGLRVAFMGVVGDDVFGHFMLDALRGRGIDTSACMVDPHVATGFTVILTKPGGDRALLTFPGSIAALCLDHLDLSMLARARHLHVGAFFLLDALRPALPGLYAQARALGLTTSLDTNWDPRGEWDVAATLLHCDLFLPNAAEVARITGQDLEAGLDTLAAQIPTLGVKLGADGGLARRGDEVVRAPALPVAVVDTTGAGDSFNAGFLCGFLNGRPLQETLDLAVACGSLSTRAAGGTTAQPTLCEIRDLGVMAAR